MLQLTKRCSEKFGKKLIGRTDMEDALKRLDKLTQEEARMATAEVLRTTHAIDKRVLTVDDRVADVSDRVASVNDRVASVDNKVAEIINGAQIVFSQAREILNLNIQMERKQSKPSNKLPKMLIK
jgi:prophage DNA circulation protein